MSGEMVFHPLLLEITVEFTAGELASLIGAKPLDLGAALCQYPGCKVFVSLDCFIFGVQQLDVGKA